MTRLEVIRTLNDHDCVTKHPIEVVVWTNEEGSRFAPAMVASGVFAGEFSLEYDLSRADLHGVTIGQELDRSAMPASVPVGDTLSKPTLRPILSRALF